MAALAPAMLGGMEPPVLQTSNARQVHLAPMAATDTAPHQT